MTATAQRFQPTYYSEIVRETDGAREPAVWASLEERWREYEIGRAHV